MNWDVWDIGRTGCIRGIVNESSPQKCIVKAHEQSAKEVAFQCNLQSGYVISNQPTANYAPDNTPTMVVCSTTIDTGSATDDD